MDMGQKTTRGRQAAEAGETSETSVRRKRRGAAKSAENKPAPNKSSPKVPTIKAVPDISVRLLAWYDRERRELPWRYGPGVKADPYKVWLSEIMLQQTTVKAVIPYFQVFTKRWPTVKKLATAPRDDVLAAWAGLGYYLRARNLHACAQVVAEQHRGKFPSTEAALLELPGIGPYTAAAIAAIGFGRRAVVVDGNVERVTARLAAIATAMPKAKIEMRAVAETLTPAARAGDFAQAMMDLGATICTPRRPSCLMCPISAGCKAHALGLEETFPRRAVKAERPVRRAVAFVALREDGAVLLRRRSDTGLLGGMMEVPSSAWEAERPPVKDSLMAAPLRAEWWAVPGDVVHVFTHFRLELQVFRALVPVDASLNLWAEPARCKFVGRRDLPAEALPSVMRKIIAHALKGV
jgi:A/G-specific adenine glycosylase